jgi:hypothetical protein
MNRPAGHVIRRMVLLPACLVSAGIVEAQEIRGLARFDARGDAVWGATVSLKDSLGRETMNTRTNRHGEFVVKAPGAGTYWLELSAKRVGRNASPVFVLDSGVTLHYEHVFRQSLTARARGEAVTSETVLPASFADSSAGSIARGVSARPVRQVRVRVLDARNETPIPRAEVALVAIDSRFEQVVGGGTDSSGVGGWRDVRQTWYRVIARRIGYEPGGTTSFPIVGESDSVDVVLRLHTVTVLDPVTVMERRINAFGFNLDLMSRYFLGGADLADRNPGATSVDDLIMSLRIPGISVATGDMTSVMRYRGQRVRVFILDGSRTSGELPLVEPSAVESLMFVPPHEAGAIFGPDAIGGVLIINTRNAPRK